MISQDIDLVAGDFNGAAWRCRSRGNLSTIDEAFADCALPTPPGPTPLWGPGSIPNNWADVCGFLKLTGSQRFWKVKSMVLSLYLDKLSVYVPMIKAAIMRRGFMCTSLTGVTSGTIRLATRGTFASQNASRILEIVLPNVTIARY